MALDAKSKQVRRQEITAMVARAQAHNITPAQMKDAGIREIHSIVMEYPEITAWLTSDNAAWRFVLDCTAQYHERRLY